MKRSTGKTKKAKTVTYTLIPEQSEIGRPMYERLFSLVDAHHEELSHCGVRVALAWCTSWKADVDGRITLGKCKKASDLDRELAPYDFVILLSRDFWQNPKVTDDQRSALMDHELMHAAVAYDEDGDPKRDDRGRYVFRIRKHDLEEFRDVVARHGLYKNDLVDFARTLRQVEPRAGEWIGYSRIERELAAIGITLPATTIATWSDEERREVLEFALFRRAAGETTVNVTVSQTIPACLAGALREKHTGSEPTPADAGDQPTTH